jgi:hypothetical protein
MPNWQARIERRIVDDLLEVANEWASDEGEPPMSAQDFIRRVRLQSVYFSREGFDFYCDDDDAFLGHVIQVRGNLEDGIVDASMQG